MSQVDPYRRTGFVRFAAGKYQVTPLGLREETVFGRTADSQVHPPPMSG